MSGISKQLVTFFCVATLLGNPAFSQQAIPAPESAIQQVPIVASGQPATTVVAVPEQVITPPIQEPVPPSVAVTPAVVEQAPVKDVAALQELTTRKNVSLQQAQDVAPTGRPLSPEDKKLLNDSSILVKETCQKRFDYYASQKAARRGYSVVVALVGSVAGAIVAPAILAGGGSAVAAAAFSGLAGATNTAQKVVAEQGITVEASQASSTKVREGVQKALDDYVTAFAGNDAPDIKLQKMQAALMRADNACFLGEY